MKSVKLENNEIEILRLLIRDDICKLEKSQRENGWNLEPALKVRNELWLRLTKAQQSINNEGGEL